MNPRYEAPLFTGYMGNGENTRTFVDGRYEPQTNVFARMVNYYEHPDFSNQKSFTELGMYYYTVVTARETVYIQDVMVESDASGAIDVICYQNQTDRAQRARVFVRPGINTIPLNFLLPRVTYEEILADQTLRPVLPDLDRIGNENVYSQYTFTYRDVNPLEACVRLTHVDYKILIEQNRLTRTLSPLNNGVDTPELIFKFGYATISAGDTSMSGSFFADQDFDQMYCFFDFRYYTRARIAPLNEPGVPDHPIRYQITTNGCVKEPGGAPDVSGYTKEKLRAFENLSYRIIDVIDPLTGLGNHSLTSNPDVRIAPGSSTPNYSGPLRFGFRIVLDGRTRVLLQYVTLSIGGQQGEYGSGDFLVGQFTAGGISEANIFKRKRKAVRGGERQKVELYITLDPEADGAQANQTTTRTTDGEIIREKFVYDVVFVPRGTVQPLLADDRWVDGYNLTTNGAGFVSGTGDYNLPTTYDPAVDPDLPDQIVCRIPPQAWVYNGDDLLQNAPADPMAFGDYRWGPMFAMQLTYVDSNITSPAVPVGCFTHGHLRSDCLHFTAEPEGGSVTDVRKLQSLLTMAPEFRVGINKQFPTARLHVGGDIEAEGLGSDIRNVLYKTIEQEFQREGIFDSIANRALEMVTEVLNSSRFRNLISGGATGQQIDLINRAMELVTETLNGPRFQDIATGTATRDLVNRALEMVTETLNERFTRETEIQEALVSQQINRALELTTEDLNAKMPGLVLRVLRRNDYVTIADINFAMQIMTQTLEETLPQWLLNEANLHYHQEGGFASIKDLNFAMRLMTDTLHETLIPRLEELENKVG